MDWNPPEARAAARFAALELNLEGTLTWTAAGAVQRYRLAYEGRPYALSGGKTFATLPELELAYDRHRPIFEWHAVCCHQLMLHYFDEPSARAAIAQWVTNDALPTLASHATSFPWTSAVQRTRSDGTGRLHTFGPPWTGVAVDLPERPNWMGHAIATERFDPAHPRVYLAAVRELIERGEPWWLAERMPTAPKARIAYRL
jgi:hypothetical protein